jgi:hypothetical protein
MKEGMSQRVSGLQKQVLALYRDFLRATRGSALANLRAHVVAEFRKNVRRLLPTESPAPPNPLRTGRSQSRLPRTDFQLIEHHIRQGRKQLKSVRAPSVSGATVAQAMRQ